MVIIITYDLRTPKDYHDLFEAIKAQADSGKWWHYMTSAWLLSTMKTPQQVVDSIQTHLESQDTLFVCELTPNYQGRLPKAAWDWITSELRQPITSFFGGIFGPTNPAVAPTGTPSNPFFGESGIVPDPSPADTHDPLWAGRTGKTGKLSDMLEPDKLKGILGDTPFPPLKPIKKPGER